MLGWRPIAQCAVRSSLVLVYVVLLAVAMHLRWRSGSWRRIRI
jgi:hypothetical protein